MRLYLINPSNPQVSILNTGDSRWNRYRVWKPLGLMTIAGLTPTDWEVVIVDENLGVPDYSRMPKPDFVGITAFTSQAPRAYELATYFRNEGVPVVLGGIHATMCREEASAYVDAIVTGEAESVWCTVLEDVRNDRLKPWYEGGLADMSQLPSARHDILKGEYAFGAIQTTRGCPLHCSFCSVTSFNGAQYRQRPIEHVIDEFRNVTEDFVLIVDDNLVGTRKEHLERAKRLFRAMIDADLKKKWVGQVTINVANDEELLQLAAAAGCKGLFIGFESPQPERLRGVSEKNKLSKCDDPGAAVRRIQRHGMVVAGSFIIGLDTDEPGIGRLIAETAKDYGIDFVNVLFLTPLPGTRLWKEMEKQGRIPLKQFPADWSYFTLTYPVARYIGLTPNEASKEMYTCSKSFYSIRSMLRRWNRNLWSGQSVFLGIVGSLSYRRNIEIERIKLDDFLLQHCGTLSGFKEKPIEHDIDIRSPSSYLKTIQL